MTLPLDARVLGVIQGQMGGSGHVDDQQPVGLDRVLGGARIRSAYGRGPLTSGRELLRPLAVQSTDDSGTAPEVAP